MLSKVREAIEKYNMLDTTECVTVALSGGADSVALLYALKSLGYDVRALHVNHMLRGEESDRDEAFVRDICQRENIPLEVHRADISKLAKERSVGLEECGREVRYALLSQDAEKHGGKIATAHTLSDSTETVLLNLARGCALSGLTGIPPVRGNIIRPLICCTREQIEAYCAENGLSFVTDSSNLTDDYARNRVRHIAVPALKTINPAVEQAFGRMTETAAQDEDFISGEVTAAIKKYRKDNGYALPDLKLMHRAILSRVLMKEYSDMTGNGCSHLHVGRMLSLIERGQGREELPCAVFAVIRKGTFRIEKKSDYGNGFEFPVSVPFEGEINGQKVKLEKITADTYEEIKKNNRYLFKNAIDCDIIFSNLVIRSRRTGDKLKQSGRGITKELRRLMNEKGIPAEKRDEVIILADDKGVIWAQGFGADEKYAVSDKTENVVVIEVENRN